MDLNTWSARDFHASSTQLLLMRLGGKPYRCEYCRLNFVSFRERLEEFSFRRWKKHRRRVKGDGAVTADAGVATTERDGQEAGEED